MRSLFIALTITFLCTVSAQDLDWWKTAIFYQIYPRSYKDSNGDGVGDLGGVIEKMGHLADLGIQSTWLSPIMKSPQADFGYDISDFKSIDPLFGTMEDFDAMIVEAKKYDIKIIMDFVPNHSSDEHEWFVKSAAKETGYEDYYVWKDGKDCDAKPWAGSGPAPCKPPNNWVSLFYGHAWTWNWQREQFYLHQFDKKQPDLNYRNPRVVQEMKNVLTFWLDRGASGFRVDAINHLFEVSDYRDEPLTGWTSDPFDYGYTHKIYTKDLDETYDMVRQWSELCAAYTQTHGTETKIIMTEAWVNGSLASRYYTESKVQIPFNFFIIENLYENSNAYSIRQQIDDWLYWMPDGATPNWVLGNHDKPRVTSRLGFERSDGIIAITMTLPGVAVTYNGEEIGMQDFRQISWEDTQDPAACNGPQEGYEDRSRDPQRTPFQWDDTANAGFTNGPRTWLPIHTNYRTLNLKQQQTAVRSYYKFYKQLSELRRDPIMMDGTFRTWIFQDNIYSHIRTHKREHLILVVNWSFDMVTIDLSWAFDGQLSANVEVVIAGHRSSYFEGDLINSRSFQVRAYDVVIVKETNRLF